MDHKTYTKSPVSNGRLWQEIQECPVVIGLKEIRRYGDDWTLIFKTDLSDEQWLVIDGVLAAHTGEPLPDDPQPAKEVITQYEKNDKTLRMACAFATTDVSGEARIAVKIPAAGRKVSYGDAEFKTRTFGDYIKCIEIQDKKRLIAWQAAFVLDSNASEPIPDEVIRENGYPLYPVLDYYDDKSLDEDDPDQEGIIRKGCAMTFQFGTTEVQPIGGYGNLPGELYLVVVAQSATNTGGIEFQVSVDWGEPNL